MKLKKLTASLLSVIMVVSSFSGTGITITANAEETSVSSDSLVLDLKMDGDLKDSSNGGNNGTVTGNGTYEDGISGKALYFDGTTYVDLGKSTELQSEDMTFSAWIKVDGTLSGENMITWFKPSGNYQGKGWYLTSLDDNTPIKISIGESSAQPMEAYVSGSRSEFFPSGEWVHIAVTYNSETKKAYFYRNGIAQETLYLNSDAAITSDSSSNKYLGFNSPNYNGGFLKAYMDEVKMYNTDLSGEDIVSLYTEFGAQFDTSEVVDADYNNLMLSFSSAKYDITLPTEGSSGSTIEWTSSDETLISKDGKVTRPNVGEADGVVTLTAKIIYGENTKEKTFEITVPAITDFKELTDFDMSEVELLDDYLLNAGSVEKDYLLSFDSDRLLKGFATIAGVESDAALYGGWESTSIKGHTLGHYLTAISQLYAYANDAEVQERVNYIVTKLSEYQLEDGYVGAVPESHYIQLENGNTTGIWVPWYTMHKIMSGLISAYELTGNELALETASKLGDWVYSRTSTWTQAVQKTVLGVEYGGMNDCMYQLYKHTQSEKHLEAAHSFDEMDLFEHLYNGEDVLNGLHANTTIPKIIGALNRYRALGETEDEAYYLQVAENFWEMVINNHTYITGGNSEWEHFGEAGILDGERTNCNCETCNTYNMLKLSRELYKITGEAKYADYYENTFINAILSSQNPETGMTTYFQPMASGYFKVYSSQFDHFWCCTGSGMENFTKLNDSIYYKNSDSIYVTQYFASKVTWEEKNIILTQENSITDTDTVKITVNTIDKATSDAKIKLRVPDWTAGEPVLKVNGETVEAVVSGGVISLDNVWNDGDTIELTLPMEVVAYSLQDNSSLIAFKYGPIVLSASLGTEEEITSTTGVNVTIPTKNVEINENIYVTEGEVNDWVSNAAENVVKKADSLEFTLSGTDSDLVFIPHYKQYTDRYGIYFYITSNAESTTEEGQAKILQLKEKGRLENATIDSVPVSNDQYELQHNMITQSSATGSFSGLMYRDASSGGYFQYDLKVDDSTTNTLMVTYFAGDAGRTFSIYVDNTLLKDVTIDGGDEEGFFQVMYELPSDMVKGKDKVTVKFAADKNGLAGGVFDRIYMLKAYSNNTGFKTITVNDIEQDFENSDDSIDLYGGTDSEKAVIKFELEDEYGLLYINDVLVDDVKEYEIDLTDDTTTLKVVVKGEDHTTQKEYEINIIKGEKPANTMVFVIVAMVAVVVIGGVIIIIKKKNKKR